MTTVWIYVDTNYYVGHPDHLKAFATQMPPMNGSERTIPRALLLDMRSWVTKPGRDLDGLRTA